MNPEKHVQKPVLKGAVAVVYLCMFLEGGSNILISALKEPLMAHFNIGLSEIGLLITIRSVICGTMPMVCGGLSDKFGRKRIILAGGLLFILHYALLPLQSTLLMFMILMAVMGLGYSFMDPSAQAVLFDSFDDAGPAMPFVQVAFAGGSFISPLLAGIALRNDLSWKYLFFLYCLFFTALTIFTFSRKFPAMDKKSGEGAESQGSIFVEQPKVFREGLTIFIFVVLSATIGSIIGNWVDVYMKDVFAFDEVNAVSVISSYQLGCIVGALIIAWLAKRLHSSKILSLLPVIAFSAVVIGLLTNNSIVFIGVIFVAGLASGTTFSLSVGLSGQLFYKNSGAATGAISSASAIGIALSSWFAGRFISIIGIHQIFIILACIIAASALMGALIRKQYLRLTAGKN